MQYIRIRYGTQNLGMEQSYGLAYELELTFLLPLTFIKQTLT